jgi:hypothetical protein
MREVNPVTRMLLRLNMVMRSFKEKNDYPILYVVDRLGDRRDAVILIVDVLYDDRERAEELVKKMLEHLGSHKINVLNHTMASYIVPGKEVWRFVAMVSVDVSQ